MGSLFTYYYIFFFSFPLTTYPLLHKKLLEVCKKDYVLIYDRRLGEDRGIGKATYYIYRITFNSVTGPWDLTRYVTQWAIYEIGGYQMSLAG